MTTYRLSSPRMTVLVKTNDRGEIVDRLPKTADGVPIVSGMSVWIIRHGPPMERRVRSVSDGLVCVTVGMVMATWSRVPVLECYSTSEAAEKARKP